MAMEEQTLFDSLHVLASESDTDTVDSGFTGLFTNLSFFDNGGHDDSKQL